MDGWRHIVSKKGKDVPILPFYSSDSVKSVFILLPALGIRGSFYKKLAAGLTQYGIATIILEQRGNGESPYRPGDGSSLTLGSYLDEDVAAVVAWCGHEFPDVPLYIGGHSLGGHVASLAAGEWPGIFSGVIHLACGFPYPSDFPAPASSFVKTMAASIPLVTRLLGYFPGKIFGFGGREYRGLMMDWRQWARSGNYDIPGFEGSGESIGLFKGKMISIAFAHDRMATHKAIERSRALFKGADVTRLKLGEAEQGDFLGHIDWGKNPVGVIEALGEWFSDT